MAFFDRKSILKIVGKYNINNTSGDEIEHDPKDDILTIVYDDYFYQATVGIITEDEFNENGNTFSIMTEVQDFFTTRITAILRTKIDGNYVVMQSFSPIPPPDDFLSKTIEVNFLEDTGFEYNGTGLHDCVQPQYPNYNCAGRIDNNGCGDGGEIIGCTDSTACSCDEPRCIGLCGVCDNGLDDNEYECQLNSATWTEYCGDELNQWQCGTTEFGFYNPSEEIPPSNECESIPIKPKITFFSDCENLDCCIEEGQQLHLAKHNIAFRDDSVWLGQDECLNYQGFINPDDWGFGDGWVINDPSQIFWDDAFPVPVNASIPRPTNWGDRRPIAIRVDNTFGNEHLNSFDTISLDIDKIHLNEDDYEFILEGGVDPGHTIDITNQGSIAKILIQFDDLFTGKFKLVLNYEDLISLKITLKNISFLRYNNETELFDDVEYDYPKDEYIEVEGQEYKWESIGMSYMDLMNNLDFGISGTPGALGGRVDSIYRLKSLFVPGSHSFTMEKGEGAFPLGGIVKCATGQGDCQQGGPFTEGYNEDYETDPDACEDAGFYYLFQEPHYNTLAQCQSDCEQPELCEELDERILPIQHSRYTKYYKQTIKLHRGRNEISLWANFAHSAPDFTQLHLSGDRVYYKLSEIFDTDIWPFLEKIATKTAEVTYNPYYQHYHEHADLEFICTNTDNAFTVTNPDVYSCEFEGVEVGDDCDEQPGGAGTFSCQPNSNYNLIVSTGRWEETIGTFDDLDSSVGLTASHFDDIYTGASATYSVTVCDDRIDPDENPYCYEGDPANGILKNEFEIVYWGKISTWPAILSYDDRDINYKVVDKGHIGLINGYVDGVVQSGIPPQTKEILYEDINTILAFEEDLRTVGQIYSDTRRDGLQGSDIDIIQYETELITHVDMDFDCVYGDYESYVYNANPFGDSSFFPETFTDVVQDGTCYDTWLGTLTSLELGNGYFFNVNNVDFHDISHSSWLYAVQSVHLAINLYYDFCGVTSGGPSLHEANSDTDDGAFCVNNTCVGGVTDGEECFTDGSRDDICFGNCCTYPNEILDWYEDGKMYLNRLRLCDDAGTYNEEYGKDVYKTYRCDDDLVEYPLDDSGGDSICSDNCFDANSNPEDCTEIEYFIEADNCDGYMDCHNNCHSEITGITNEFSYFDKYGICCKLGNMDADGKCFGNSSTLECGYDYVVSGPGIEIGISENDFIQNSEENSGSFIINLTPGGDISEVVIPFTQNLRIKNAYFYNVNETDIDIIGNNELSFIELFDISITTDNKNEILITSLFDNVFFNSSSAIPIMIEWELTLPNSMDEVIDTFEHDNFCVNLSDVTVYKLDTALGVDIDNAFPLQFDVSGCFRLNDNSEIFDGVNVYGCDDDTSLNENYYCNNIDGIYCFSDNICEYVGCDGVVTNILGDLVQLDDCNVCPTDDGYVSGSCYDCNNEPFGDAIEDCNGECGGTAELDECGVCNGDNLTCTGCTDDTACNYNSLAIVDSGDCIYKGIYYLDADGDGGGCPSTEIELCPDNPLVIDGTYVSSIGEETEENCFCNGVVDSCGLCNGNNACIGCTDSRAYNYSVEHTIACNGGEENDCCLFESDIQSTVVQNWLNSVTYEEEISQFDDGTSITPRAIIIHNYTDGYTYRGPCGDGECPDSKVDEYIGYGTETSGQDTFDDASYDAGYEQGQTDYVCTAEDCSSYSCVYDCCENAEQFCCELDCIDQTTVCDDCYAQGQDSVICDDCDDITSNDNQVIEDFIMDAIDNQVINVHTTTPGSNEVQAAIFEHEDNHQYVHKDEIGQGKPIVRQIFGPYTFGMYDSFQSNINLLSYDVDSVISIKQFSNFYFSENPDIYCGETPLSECDTSEIQMEIMYNDRFETYNNGVYKYFLKGSGENWIEAPGDNSDTSFGNTLEECDFSGPEYTQSECISFGFNFMFLPAARDDGNYGWVKFYDIGE